jgi:hypothetical protein
MDFTKRDSLIARAYERMATKGDEYGTDLQLAIIGADSREPLPDYAKYAILRNLGTRRPNGDHTNDYLTAKALMKYQEDFGRGFSYAVTAFVEHPGLLDEFLSLREMHNSTYDILLNDGKFNPVMEAIMKK